MTGQLYQERGDEIASWLKRTFEHELSELAQNYPSEKTTFVIEWDELFVFDRDIALDVRDFPERFRETFAECVRDVVPQQALVDRTEDDEVVRGELLEIAFIGAGEPQSVTDLIRGDSIGDLVTLRGKTTKASDTRPLPTIAGLKCQNCGVVTRMHQPLHGTNLPDMCDSCESTNSGWEPKLDESEWVYHQLVRVKHEPGESDSDSHIDVHLTGDFAGALSGGESVDITGVLDDVWPDGLDGGTPDFILDADAVRKHESDFESIDVASHKDRIQELAAGEEGDPYELLTQSMAPGIHGGEALDRTKLALICQLFGSQRVEKPDGTSFRGDIHQLLVGPPGTGKSSLQDAVAEYSPRVATVSGKNATKAGVTAAAVRDDFGDTEWSIEAGAFVQANKGICIVDELDKVDNDVISSLHSALERQQLSIAKAGINADLQCQTAMLGACNPEHERFIDGPSVVEQIPVGSAMRSRLDGVFIIRDPVDEEDDRMKVEAMFDSIASGENVQTTNFDDGNRIDAPLDRETIQAWVAYARQHHEVALDMERLKERIGDYYVGLREQSEGSGAPVNLRKAGSVLRYAVASARIRLGDRVIEEDIERAISIVSTSLSQIGLTNDGQWSVDAEVAAKVTRAKTQADRKERIKSALDTSAGKTPAEIAAQIEGVSETVASEELELLAKKGEALRPETGVYRKT